MSATTNLSPYDRTLLDGTEGIDDFAFEEVTYFYCLDVDRRAVRRMLNRAINRRFDKPLYRTLTVRSPYPDQVVVYFDYRPDADVTVKAFEEARLEPIWQARLEAAYRAAS